MLSDSRLFPASESILLYKLFRRAQRSPQFIKEAADLLYLWLHMKRTIRRYIKRISAKNLVLPGIIFAFIALAAFLIPFDDMLFPGTVSSVQELKEAAASGTGYISWEISDLNYTGYDYYEGADAAASFYYVFTDDETECVFFLIEKDADISSGRARLVYKSEYINTFLVNYASDLGLSEEALNRISGGYIVSGPDYDYAAYILLAVFLFAAALTCVIYILMNITFLLFPSLHPSCRRLKKYGLSGRDFSEIDEELENDTIVEAGNMFATSHYLIVFEKGTIFMIPLFNIIWAYQYVARQIFVSRRLLSYTLVIYTSPGGKIVMRGNRKKNTDKILAFLDRDFSHIAIGYTEEQHKKIKEMFKKGEL